MALFTLDSLSQARPVGRLSLAVWRRAQPGSDCYDPRACDRERFTLHFEGESRAAAVFTFWEVQQAANRLSNALRALGNIRARSSSSKLCRWSRWGVRRRVLRERSREAAL
jgi:hypothetical protein